MSSETAEERETRLNQTRGRLAAETPQERETRLQQMRDRLAVETPEVRETRLQQMHTVAHPCDILPLAQARPIMLCIYTSYS